jgi:cell wall-associated NlpC family hydrolase
LIAASPLGAGAATVTTTGGVQVIVDGAATPAPAHRPHPHPKPQAARRTAVPTGSPQGNALARYALAFVGTPYVWGGTSPRGFDCSGFVYYVYAESGIGIPRTADLQWNAGRPVSDPEPGDLLFFQTYDYGASHVAIYLGNGWFVQAIAPDVHISNFNAPYFRSRYLGARRLLPA